MTTREEIIHHLKLKGPTKAEDLADVTGLTAMACRQHLYQLRDEGEVGCCLPNKSGRGRPAKLWQLTDESYGHFEDAHDDLTIDMLDAIAGVFGKTGLNKVMDYRSTKQKEKYSAEMQGKNIKSKIGILMKLRSDEGYMASVELADNGDYIFNENHCPICSAAKKCPKLCNEELNVFQDLFAGQASVEREEHIAKGARRCSYRVSKT